MGDSPPDPEPPFQQSSRQRTSQASDQFLSPNHSQPQPMVPGGVQQLLDTQLLQSSQEMPASQTNLLGWPRGVGLTQPENLMFQAEEPQLGGTEYLPMNAGFLSGYQHQPSLNEDRIQAAHNAGLVQQLPQGQGSLFQQPESAYQEPQPDPLRQFSTYQRDLQFSEGTQHRPYIRDDAALHFTRSELGFMPFNMEVPEPEPRELAVQNAKAYLLQTSVNCNLSL